MTERWPRCGSAQPGTVQLRHHVVPQGAPSSHHRATVRALRGGLERAEHPQGVLRGGAVRRAAPATGGEPRRTQPAGASIGISGTAEALLRRTPEAGSLPPRPREGPLVIPRDREKRLPTRRKHAVVRFAGRDAPPAEPDWQCAICLRSDWATESLARMPHCAH
eukprot:7130102-Prymnesium_polylepis.1